MNWQDAQIYPALHAVKRTELTKKKIISTAIGLDTVRHSTTETKSDWSDISKFPSFLTSWTRLSTTCNKQYPSDRFYQILQNAKHQVYFKLIRLQNSY